MFQSRARVASKRRVECVGGFHKYPDTNMNCEEEWNPLLGRAHFVPEVGHRRVWCVHEDNECYKFLQKNAICCHVTASRLNQCLNLGLIAPVDGSIKAGLLSIEFSDNSNFLFEAWSKLECVFTYWQ